MDGMTAWHKAAEDGWYDSWHAKLTTTLPFAFSRSVASRHSAEKRNPEDSLAAHTVPRRSAELKVAVKAMTT